MTATASRYTSTELGRALPPDGIRGAVAHAAGQALAQGRQVQHVEPIASLRDRARGGSEVPAAAGRDQRIDLLRGFAVVAMVVDHIAGPSLLYGLTGGNRFYTSAAEAFIFISGLVMGLVYCRLIERDGLGASLRRAIERAATLYLFTVTLTLLFVPISELLGMPWAQGLNRDDPLAFIVSVLTLHRTYYLVDIPLLYTLLILIAPLALVLLSQGRTAVVLGASWALWTLYQVFPAQANAPWPIDGNHLFFFSAWQVFFFTGLTLGWHHGGLSQQLAEFPRRAALALSGCGFAALIGLYVIADRLPGMWPGETGRAADLQLFLVETFFSKADVRVGRIVASIVVFGFFYLLVTELWRPLKHGLGWLLLPLGEKALYAYAAHIALAIPTAVLIRGLSDSAELPHVVNAAIQIATVAGIWLLIQGRVLFFNPSGTRARYGWPLGATLFCALVLPLNPSAAEPPVAPAAAGTDQQAVRFARAFGTPVPSSPLRSNTVAIMPPLPIREDVVSQPLGDERPAAHELVGPLLGTFREGELYSTALGRVVSYLIYLPPGYYYAGGPYPVLYMLHGASGSNHEWAAYGLVDWADYMISRGQIDPLIIVLPEGGSSYWVDSVEDPVQAYGQYLSFDLVSHVDATYRVSNVPMHRAVGGLSMGATGALVHAFRSPHVFGVAGAHSPALPREGERPILGLGQAFAERDPVSLAGGVDAFQQEPAIWMDVGDEDPDLRRVGAFHDLLGEREIEHQWRVFPGEHFGDYWARNVPQYLRFYHAAFNRHGWALAANLE